MGDMVLPGDPDIRVALRRSARARRLSLRVARVGGDVTLTLPRALPMRVAQQFLQDKEAWLRRTLARQHPLIRIAPGVQLPIEGRSLPLVTGTGRSARVLSDRVELPTDRPGTRLRAALKFLARERLSASVGHHAEALGKPFGRITLRDTRSRWGSCSATGNLNFSWRLILAPPAVLDYVAAHEVAHLAQMNHSPAFWAVTARLCPAYQTYRRWLRDHGPALQAYCFED